MPSSAGHQNSNRLRLQDTWQRTMLLVDLTESTGIKRGSLICQEHVGWVSILGNRICFKQEGQFKIDTAFSTLIGYVTKPGNS